MPPLLLIASVSLETDPLRKRLEDMREVRIGRKAAWSGSLAGTPVILLAGGMGKTNAAQALTAALESAPVRGVLGFGVGGAYPRAGVGIGGVALATVEIYGDEGVQAPAGWLSTREIGIPLVDAGAESLYNEIPLPPRFTKAASAALSKQGLRHNTGAFVTVSACSGTDARGTELAARHSAICETMEGAAYAHVAALYDVPFVEVRGISNLVEDRDPKRWRLAAAADAAADAAACIAIGWSAADAPATTSQTQLEESA